MESIGKSYGCPISGKDYEVLEIRQRGGVYIKSPFAGGTYFITASAFPEVSGFEGSKTEIARWVFEQNQLGSEFPEITTSNWRSIQSRRSLKVTSKIQEYVRFLHSFAIEGGRVKKFGRVIGMHFDSTDDDSRVFAACDLDCDDIHGLMRLRKNAIQAGWLDDANEVTILGHQLLEQNELLSGSSSQAFVAMWFDPTLSKELYDNAIIPAVRRAGYEAFRIDKKEHSNRIDDEIVGEIRRSRFLIADFTCPVHQIDSKELLEHRGGVYFEAGLAQGMGLPVIWTCHQNLVKDIHFDTRQYNHILWDPEKLEEFGNALEKRIRAVLGQGPLP